MFRDLIAWIRANAYIDIERGTQITLIAILAVIIWAWPKPPALNNETAPIVRGESSVHVKQKFQKPDSEE